VLYFQATPAVCDGGHHADQQLPGSPGAGALDRLPWEGHQRLQGHRKGRQLVPGCVGKIYIAPGTGPPVPLKPALAYLRAVPEEPPACSALPPAECEKAGVRPVAWLRRGERGAGRAPAPGAAQGIDPGAPVLSQAPTPRSTWRTCRGALCARLGLGAAEACLLCASIGEGGRTVMALFLLRFSSSSQPACLSSEQMLTLYTKRQLVLYCRKQ